jgi:hypothetical protein
MLQTTNSSYASDGDDNYGNVDSEVHEYEPEPVSSATGLLQRFGIVDRVSDCQARELMCNAVDAGAKVEESDGICHLILEDCSVITICGDTVAAS